MDIPTVDAIEDSHGLLSMWCQYCARWHYHGKGEGHRVAHCPDQPRRGWLRRKQAAFTISPYRQTGYILRSIGKGKIPNEKREQYVLLAPSSAVTEGSTTE